MNEASAREKSIRHTHPRTLHLWCARRPLAACRAVLFASLVDDPDSDPLYRGADGTSDERRAGVKRAQLFNLIEELVKWEKPNNSRFINAARAVGPRGWRLLSWTDWIEEEPCPEMPCIRIARLHVRVPEVICLARYDRRLSVAVALSRRNVAKRDHYACKYSGAQRGARSSRSITSCGSPALSMIAPAFRGVWHRIRPRPATLGELGTPQSSKVRENPNPWSVSRRPRTRPAHLLKLGTAQPADRGRSEVSSWDHPG